MHVRAARYRSFCTPDVQYCFYHRWCLTTVSYACTGGLHGTEVSVHLLCRNRLYNAGTTVQHCPFCIHLGVICVFTCKLHNQRDSHSFLSCSSLSLYKNAIILILLCFIQYKESPLLFVCFYWVCQMSGMQTILCHVQAGSQFLAE